MNCCIFTFTRHTQKNSSEFLPVANKVISNINLTSSIKKSFIFVQVPETNAGV